jgi:hypothetical protein
LAERFKLTDIISLPTQGKTAFSDFGHQTDIKTEKSLKTKTAKPQNRSISDFAVRN